ncbi:retrovirus-related pol polyprotein from transposon TNT 1-94 [Tanacetum coccineum]
MIQYDLRKPSDDIRTDNGTEFVNQTLREYYEKVGISHETSVARSPQQNGVVERRNRTLIEAARTMLIYAKAPLFLWAEAVATACYTQNRSMIRRRHGKTPYELLHNKPPDLSYLHVFGALCYQTNDSENFGTFTTKRLIWYFHCICPHKERLSDLTTNEKTNLMKPFTLILMSCLRGFLNTAVQDPPLHEMTPVSLSSGLVPNPSSSTPFVPPTELTGLLFPTNVLMSHLMLMYKHQKSLLLFHKQFETEHAVSTGSPSSTTVDQECITAYNHSYQHQKLNTLITHDV